MIKISKSSFKELYDVACETWQTKFNEKFSKFNFTDYIEFEENFLEEMKQACSSEQLLIFNKIFKEHLPKSPFEGIKDYKSFCKISGKEELKESDFKKSDNSKKTLTQAKITQFEDYFNNGEKLDWNNKSQAKWYPWYETGSGSLWFVGCHDRDYRFAGAAGYFKSQEIAKFVGETFIDVYKDLIY